jgi:hypothetical protein
MTQFLEAEAADDDGQEGGRLRRHHQAHEFFLRSAVGEPPPRGLVLHPLRVLEELARRLLRAELLTLLADLAIERSFGNAPHRVDERFVPDLLKRAKGQSPGLRVGLASPPLEAARLPPEGEPNAPQQLYPILLVVLELGPHWRGVEDVLDLLCAQHTRLVQGVFEQACAHAHVVAIPGDI